MRHKLGKLDPLPARTATIDRYQNRRSFVPASCVYASSVAWGMDNNDRIGDCTIAGVDHLLKAWDAEVGLSDALSDVNIEQTYFQLTGGPDSGLVERDVLDHWQNEGLFSHQIKAYAPVQLDASFLREALYLYGGVYLGVQLPETAEEQFAAGEPWGVVPGAQIVGGHCIVMVGYNSNGASIVTWGQRTWATWDWMKQYLDEAWVAIGPEFVQVGKGPVVDVAALTSDLGSL